MNFDAKPYKHKKSNLILEVEVIDISKDDEPLITLRVILINQAEVIARHPFVAFRTVFPVISGPPKFEPNLMPTYFFNLNTELIVYPGVNIFLGDFSLKSQKHTPIVIEFIFAAEDMQAKERKLTTDVNALQKGSKFLLR
jgi:hypothetical protein